MRFFDQVALRNDLGDNSFTPLRVKLCRVHSKKPNLLAGRGEKVHLRCSRFSASSELQDFNGDGDHPNFQLPKPFLQRFLPSEKPIAILRGVFNIKDEADEFVFIHNLFVHPDAPQRMQIYGQSAELLSGFQLSSLEFFLNGRAVIIPYGQEHFVALEQRHPNHPAPQLHIGRPTRPALLKRFQGQKRTLPHFPERCEGEPSLSAAMPLPHALLPSR